MTEKNCASPPSAFSVRILGCGSAKPTLRHAPSAQALFYHGRVFLIDCGEGVQIQMERYGVSAHKISDIFISHLHGDHFLGLPGLLGTMCLNGRTTPVRVHISAEGSRLLKAVTEVVSPGIGGMVEYCVMEPGRRQCVYEDAALEVHTVPLHHRVPACGFYFREKPKERHLRPDAIERYAIPYAALKAIKAGAAYERPGGGRIANAELTAPPSPSLSYAYCSDTAFAADVAEAVRAVTVLYHEATYGDANAAKASMRGHSTAREAGVVARIAGAGALVIGHYSAAVDDEEALAMEAAEEFGGPVFAAAEGMLIEVRPAMQRNL